jgi:hypothetical protein
MLKNANAYTHLNLSKFEDTKGAVWNLKSKKNRQHNGKAKDIRTNNDLQNTTEKTKDWPTRTLQKNIVRKGKQFLLSLVTSVMLEIF